MSSGTRTISPGNTRLCRLRRKCRNSLCLLVLPAVCLIGAVALTGCKAWRTITTTATYSAAPDKSGNPVTTIQTKTVEEYTGVKKN